MSFQNDPDRTLRAPGATARVIGRGLELGALERFLDSLSEGRSGVLVVNGEPGIGKTTILEQFAAGRQTACRIESCAGVESEMELAWAGLHQFCAPLLDRLGRIPGPQRLALSTAFGMEEGPTPDPFLVGLAVLSLLAEAADDRPIAYIVDDAYALDQASLRALAFVGRRLQVDAVGLIFAVRLVPPELVDFPELRVTGLTNADAGALLDGVASSRLDPQVRERIIAETSGNPLAIMELAQGGHLQRLAGGYDTPLFGPTRPFIEGSFVETLEDLPPSTQRLLLLAAAEPTGDTALLARAAKFMDVEIPDADDMSARRLITFTPTVRFRHPLVRSTVYGASSEPERRAAHRALARATDPESDPDRRAWHLGQSQEGPDESIAAQLERSAERALTRAGFTAAAAFLARAARLTPEPAIRARRELAAASAYFQSGAPDGAIHLLESAEAHGLDDERLLAGVQLLRGQVAFHLTREGHAPTLLLDAARRLEQLDPPLAREAYLEGLTAAYFACSASALRAVAEAALTRAPPMDRPRPVDLLLDAMTARFARGLEAAAIPMTRATDAMRAERPPSAETMRWMWVGARGGMEIMDCDAAFTLAERQVQIIRDRGALLLLPIPLTQLANVHLLRGNLEAGESLAREAIAVSVNASVPPIRWPLLMALALRGDTSGVPALANSILSNAGESGQGMIVINANAALAIFSNGSRDFRTALNLAMAYAADRPEALCGSTFAFEFAEAAARVGEPGEIAAARDFVGRLTGASVSNWANGLRALTDALLCVEGQERRYRESLASFRDAGLAMYESRVHLLLGEWLRSERRLDESRAELREAQEMMSRCGMKGFASRATRELELAGDTNARRRRANPDDALTPQEFQIAQMAAAGLSNREIGEQLFLSHRTVGSHLYRVYPKLGITSRNQLHGALAARRLK